MGTSAISSEYPRQQDLCQVELRQQFFSDLFILFPLQSFGESVEYKHRKQIASDRKTSDKMKDKTIVKIESHLEMVGFIKTNGTQCRFVSMVSETEPKLRAGCPFKGVRKVSRKRGMINANYNTAVRKRIAERLGVELKEVEYENGQVWYKHLQTVDNKTLPLVVNKNTPDNGEYYLQYYPTAAENVYQMPNGDPVEESQLEPYFYKRTERDNFKPVVIAIKVSNIKELRASGVIMQAEDLPEAEAALSAAE